MPARTGRVAEASPDPATLAENERSRSDSANVLEKLRVRARHSSYWANGYDETGGREGITPTRRASSPARGTGRRRSMTASTTLKITETPPIPIASSRMAAAAKPGRERRARHAYR